MVMTSNPPVGHFKHIGFSGTRTTPDQEQQEWLYDRLQELRMEGAIYLHHGDCVGADQYAHDMADELDYKIIIHPPVDKRLRAFCNTGWCEIREPKPYLDRNRDIVEESGILIALPKGERPANLKGAGTWSTIAYAERMKKPLEWKV